MGSLGRTTVSYSFFLGDQKFKSSNNNLQGSKEKKKLSPRPVLPKALSRSPQIAKTGQSPASLREQANRQASIPYEIGREKHTPQQVVRYASVTELWWLPEFTPDMCYPPEPNTAGGQIFIRFKTRTTRKDPLDTSNQPRDPYKGPTTRRLWVR